MDHRTTTATHAVRFADASEIADYAMSLGENDDGRLPRDEISWDFDPEHPVADLLAIMSEPEWRLWLDAEMEMARHDLGGDERWRVLLTEDIVEPVVILDHDGLVIWDGWHRCAAAVVKGAASIPCVLGREATRTFSP